MKLRGISRSSALLALALVALLIAALTWATNPAPNSLEGLNTSAASEGDAAKVAAKKIPCGKYAKAKKCNDSDNDGIPDYKDKDDDNDGVKDAKDKDDDGDGVPDKCEKKKKPKKKKRCIDRNT